MARADPGPGAAARRSRLLEFKVEPDRVRLSDGATRALLRTQDVDVDSLEAGRRAALLAAFGRLCRTADTPLQLCVRIRRSQPGNQALGAAAGFQRDITLVLSAAPDSPEALLGRVRWAQDCLRTGGLATWLLTGSALRDRLSDLVAAAPAHRTGATGAGPNRPETDREALELTHSAGHVHGAGGYCAAVMLSNLPGIPVEAGWLRPVLTVATACDIAIHLDPVATGAALQRLRRRLRELHADRMVDIEAGRLNDARVDSGVAAAAALQARLVRNEARALCLSVVVAVRAPDRPSLSRATARVTEAFGTCLAGSRLAHLEHLPALLSTAPIGRNLTGVRKLVDSAAATTCIPWVETACDDAGGYALGRAMPGGRPVRLDPFETERHSNANIVVLASSGHGKSHTTALVCLEAGARGVPSIIIDPEGEYRQVVASLGGTYLSLHSDTQASLNLLDAARLGDAGATEAATAVVALTALLCGGLDATERAQVDLTTRALLGERLGSEEMPTLSDCLPGLRTAAPRVAPVLQRFCSGPLGHVFDRPSTPLPLDVSVGFGLRDLPAELVPPSTLILAEWLWATIRRAPRRRHLIFDEAGLLGQHAALRTLLVQLARRCRKYDTSLVVVTQNASDLLRSEDGVVVLTNPSIALLGAHRGAELQRIHAAFTLTDGQRQLLESAGRGEFLLLAGDRRLAIRVRGGPGEAALLGGA
ncbi:MAG: hypothetical protein NVSMB29_13400 [Candidatus Dormibacteria bacterium]